MRGEAGLINFRARAVFEIVKAIFLAAQERFGFRIVEFSLQRNHLHLIAEAGDWKGLARGVKGLCVRLARAINRAMGRKGRVFAHRYDAHVLRSPREVRNSLLYVLNNAKKHAQQAGVTIPLGWLDPYSSAGTFEHWAEDVAAKEREVVRKPRTWLLAVGWLRHGKLRIDEKPFFAR